LLSPSVTLKSQASSTQKSNKMFKFVAILLVSCLALASATNVKRCKNGQPFPLSVDVEGCDQPPCDVIKGSSA
ncbi:hypothetical protein DOY81_007564, partial [Sarcophaga bullata]